MAKSGYKDVAVANYITLRFSWTAGTANIASNYTPVSWKLQLISSNSTANINSTASKDYSVTVDGSKKTGTNTVGLSGGDTKTLASGSKNIYHDSDGTCTFSYSFSQEFAITYSGESVGTKSGSGTGTLDTIPRKSVLGTISNFTIGNTINIPITKYYSGFTDTLTIKLGSTTIKTISSVTNGYDVSFTTAELNNIYSLLPSATKGTFTFTLTTKNGDTTIGTSSQTATGSINANIKPSISSVSIAEAVSGINAQFGGYVQNQSKIKGTITAAAGNGSSIASYKTVINGNTYTTSTFTTGALKTSGSNTYTVTITDKRGRTATTSGTYTVIAYTIPQITTFNVVRCLADGTEDVEGEYVKINVNSSISSVSSKNTKSFKLEYKKKSATTWTAIQTYTAGYTYTVTNSVKSGFTGDSPYDFRITATDFFHNATKLVSISTAYTIMDFKNDGTGIAFGRVATDAKTLDIGFDKTYLSTNSYMSGEKRSDAEKNLFIQSTGNGTYNHDCKLYGGNGSSNTSIGMWDNVNTHLIYRYLCSVEEFHFSDDMKILQGGNPILVQALFNNGANSGNFRMNNNLCIQWGKVSVTPEAANTTYNMAVKFPTAYSTSPCVFIIGQSSAPQNYSFSIGQTSANLGGFDIYLNRTTAAATSFHWVAIGKV